MIAVSNYLKTCLYFFIKFIYLNIMNICHVFFFSLEWGCSLSTVDLWMDVHTNRLLISSVDLYTNKRIPAMKIIALSTEQTWILRARDRDRDILARLRFGHQRPVNRGCPTTIGHPRFTGRWCPSRCPRIFSQSVIVYILVFFVWTPAI